MKISEEIMLLLNDERLDGEQKKDILKIAIKVGKLEAFVRECRDNFDCDEDAHKYKTFCRSCAATAILE